MAKFDESAEMAQALLRCAGTGVYIVQNGKFRYVNSLFLELTGYSEPELLGKYSLDLVHPEDRETVRKKAIDSLKGGSSLPFEYRFVKKNGEIIWVLEKVTSTEYKGKRATVGSFLDITERRQAEERFQDLFENASDLIQAVVPDGSFLYVNRAWRLTLGYSEDEIAHLSLLDIVHPESQAHCMEMFQRVMAGENVYGVEAVFVAKGGKQITVEGNVSCRFEEGKPVSTRGIFRNVTEHKRMEEALKQSEEKYRTILQNMEDAYFEIDLAGNFTFFNDSMCRALGYSREELMGMDSRACTAQEDAEPTYENLAEMYRTGEPGKTISLKFVRKDGGIRFSDTRISALLNEKGEIVGFRGIGRDVTERRRLEQKLDEMATHDPLTGLPNRLLLNDRLAVGLTQAQRNDTRLAIMMLDLDRFKDVNDTLGHGVGDQLLRAAGERMTGLVRKSDTVARMGGDEFVLLLPQIAKIEDVTKVAHKILEAFRKPFVFGGHQIYTTTSIGIAIYPQDGEDAETLLKHTDTAMYWVKEQGRDNYELYSGGRVNDS